MKFLQKGRPFLDNFIAGKKDELEVLAKNPESTARRYLMSRLISKVSSNPKLERQRTNLVQDANDLLEYGDTQLSRRAFLDQAFKRVVDRTVVPNVRDEVKERLSKPIEAAYPLMKQAQDVLDTAPNNVELQRRKEARKAAQEAAKRFEETQATLDVLEYSYMSYIASFKYNGR